VQSVCRYRDDIGVPWLACAFEQAAPFRKQAARIAV
jgi:hypothetical protein